MKIKVHILGAVLLSAFFCQINVFAETGAETNAQANEKMADLRKLKETNPAEFERLMQQRKNDIREKLDKLKQENPEKYEKITKMMKENQVDRLKRLREENPEQFQKIMEKSREKLEEMKKNDPEKFEQFMKNRQKVATNTAEKPAKAAKKGWWGQK